MRLDRIAILVLCVGLLAGLTMGALPMSEPQSQPASDTQSQPAADTQNQSSFSAESQSASEAQSLPASQHEIIAEKHIDVPAQTVNFRGNTYEVTLIGRAEAGEQLNVHVEGPGNERYSSALVNPRGQGPPSDVGPPQHARGNSRASFATSGIPPGMYFVTVRDQNRVQAVQPVAVSATETSLSGPDCVGAGTSATFEVYVNEGQVGDISRVELVAFGQNETVSVTAERERANLYRAELPFEGTSLNDAAMLVHAKVYAGNGQGPGNGQGNAPSLRDVVGISKQSTLYVVQDEANCG